MTGYKVRVDDNVVGPVSFDQLKRGFAGGKVPDHAEVSHDGVVWSPIVKVLGEESASTTPGESASDTSENSHSPQNSSATRRSSAATYPAYIMAGIAACVAIVSMVRCQSAHARVEELAETNKVLNGALESAEGTAAKTTSQLTTTREELEGAKKTLAKVAGELAELKRGPQFVFDKAVEKAEAAEGDSGDKAAINAYQAVIDRFPNHPLAEAAKERIADIKERIDKRARKLEVAQSEVQGLIKSCRKNKETARKARDGSLRFTMGNQLDMNSALAGDRRARKLERKAEAAKKKALKLLESGTVPDPEGKLVKAARGCDELGT